MLAERVRKSNIILDIVGFFISDRYGPVKLRKRIKKYYCNFFSSKLSNQAMPQPETDILIRRALKGDMGAYRAIIEQNQRLVVSLVYKMVQQKEDREDMCQEIFIKVYEKLGSF